MDVYQLLVGEIGIPRREFLYELHFWEVRRIIKGYRRRDWLIYQLLAENVFASMYAFRENNKGMTPQKMFPDLFKVEDDAPAPPITEEEFKYEEELIKNFTW